MSFAALEGFEGDKWLALAGSIAGAGLMLYPRVLEWWQAFRDASRKQHFLDIEAENQYLLKHARQIAELERQVTEFKLKFELFKCPYSNGSGPYCEPGKTPGEPRHDKKE